MDLRESVGIITGAGSGIGRAIALELSRQGMTVVCAGRREDRLRETTSAIEKAGGRALAVGTDVTDARQVKRLVDQTIAKYGKIDLLFNNAGSFDTIGGLWEVDPEIWWRDVTINLKGPMLTSHAVLPHMMKRNAGVILNMNGGGALAPLPGGSAYGSSKAALLRLTDTLARELERAGSAVIVCAIGPGFVRTEMTDLQANTPAGQKWLPGSKSAFEAGKDRPPEDCARATVQLLKHMRPEFNGRIFNVDHNFADLAANAAEIVEKDRLTMRSK